MKIWKIITICLLLIVGYFSARLTFYMAQGPDVAFQIDQNHRIMGWPGFLIQYNKQKDEYTGINLKDESIPSQITKFAITDKYLILEARQGWLAIDRNSLKAFGYCNDIAELESKVGANFKVKNFVNEIPWDYLLVYRSTKNVVASTVVVFLIIIATVICLPPKKEPVELKLQMIIQK